MDAMHLERCDSLNFELQPGFSVAKAGAGDKTEDFWRAIGDYL
jgi:hypothetical protein